MTQTQQISTATPAMIQYNREQISGAHPNQVLYVKYGPTWDGIAQVKQVVKKPGKGGETFLVVRFHGTDRMMRLGWRDANILAIKTLELEELEAYFVHREQARVRAQARHQTNMLTGAGTTAAPVAKRTRGPNKPKVAPKALAPQPQTDAAGNVIGPPVLSSGGQGEVATPAFLNQPTS